MVLTNMNMVKKKTQGRQKIEIKKIQEVNNRQVTFSKRRAGLFKKASELCVLTGAELAIMVRSPGGRVFAFGHPSADLVVDKYLTSGGTTSKSNNMETLINPQPMNEFNQHYLEISKELEKEKKRNENINESNMMNNGVFWWDRAIEGMTRDELQQFVPSLEELKKKVLMRADELMMIKSSSLSQSKSLVGVNQIPRPVVKLENHDNMVYGSNTFPMIPPAFGFRHGNI